MGVTPQGKKGRGHSMKKKEQGPSITWRRTAEGEAIGWKRRRKKKEGPTFIEGKHEAFNLSIQEKSKSPT